MRIHLWGKIFLLCTIVSLFAGCSTASQQSDTIVKLDLEDFLLAADEMPSNSWAATKPSSVVIDRERTSDYLSIAFFSNSFPNDLPSVQEVYRYRSIRLAKLDFEYATTELGGSYIPSGWAFRSEGADESQISCTDYPNVSFPVCFWIARYGRIVVNFHAWLVPDRMELTDMENTVKKIDQKAIDLLNK